MAGFQQFGQAKQLVGFVWVQFMKITKHLRWAIVDDAEAAVLNQRTKFVLAEYTLWRCATDSGGHLLEFRPHKLNRRTAPDDGFGVINRFRVLAIKCPEVNWKPKGGQINTCRRIINTPPIVCCGLIA
jgi:hypothetical protein